MIFNKMRGVHLAGHKEISTTKPIKDYLAPDRVFLPLGSLNLVYKQEVSIGDHVKKGQTVLSRVDRFAHPISSPISGVVVGIKKMWHATGKMIEMLEIENDFKEEVVSDFGCSLGENPTKEEIIARAKDAGLVGLGGAGFPTYVKYSGKLDTVIINAAECEPYITADYMLIKESPEKLLKGITYIMKAVCAKVAYIAIKKNKKAAIDALNKHLKDYPNIHLSLLKDEYPAGWERYIVEKITHKKYNVLPSEVKALVNNVQTAIALFEAVEYNKPLIEKVITITGEAIKEPQNYRVKIGTNVAKLIEESSGYVDGLEDVWMIAGGPMTGKTVLGENLIVSANLSSVIVKKKDAKLNNPACMGCGKCASNCPARLTPTSIKLAFDLGDVKELKALNVTKCVQCGLCSYVCPSRVEMTETVGKAKDLVMKQGRK